MFIQYCNCSCSELFRMRCREKDIASITYINYYLNGLFQAEENAIKLSYMTSIAREQHIEPKNMKSLVRIETAEAVPYPSILVIDAKLIMLSLSLAIDSKFMVLSRSLSSLSPSLSAEQFAKYLLFNSPCLQ